MAGVLGKESFAKFEEGKLNQAERHKCDRSGYEGEQQDTDEFSRHASPEVEKRKDGSDNPFTKVLMIQVHAKG